MDLLIFIGAIAALIFFHELGHFMAARFFKVGVDEFGIGFPPRMVRLFHWRGTDYTINWLPLGGFVRLSGENDPDVPGGFMSAHPLKRIAILLAGPAMNILIAILLYSLAMSRVGIPDASRVLIMDVAANSPAAQAGLASGDLLVRINEVDANSTDAVQQAVRDSLGKDTQITVERNGETLQYTLVPRENPPEGEGAIGIVMGHPSEPINIVRALPLGAGTVTDIGYNLLTLPMQVARGSVAPDEARLIGFKGMYDIYQEVKEVETSPAVPASLNLLAYFAMISTSLGVLNLLPIPALDGGRILFTLPELFFGKRLPPRLETAVNAVSFMLLIALLVYINLQDFINPIQLKP
ncbi:MAG: M50 family metallopeptidase [Anaerolineales bacterium]|jgi:regulator of sigma E protease